MIHPLDPLPFPSAIAAHPPTDPERTSELHSIASAPTPTAVVGATVNPILADQVGRVGDPDLDSADEPRTEFLAMAQTSFTHIVSTAEEIAWEHETPIDLQDEVGYLVGKLWRSLAEADGIVTAAEQTVLDLVVAGNPVYAGALAKYAFAPPFEPRRSLLMQIAKDRPIARRHLLVELEAFGYALAAVDRIFDHDELEALHSYLKEIVRGVVATSKSEEDQPLACDNAPESEARI